MLDSKGYEREGVCRVLARLGDLTGSTITLDALHACHAVCDQAAQHHANMIVTVKDNAKALREELGRQFEQADAIATATTEDAGHSRREHRSIEVIPLDGKAMQWLHLRWVMRITRRTRIVRGRKQVGQTEEVAYAVATHGREDPPSPEQFLKWIRGHWAIENRLHHRKDRTLMEDRSRLKKSSARIMAAARTFVTSIIGTLGGYMPNHRIRLTGDRQALFAILDAKSLAEWTWQCIR